MVKLDTCLVPPSLTDDVSSFAVVKTTRLLPSGLAPTSMSLEIPETPLHDILGRAELLGTMQSCTELLHRIALPRS